MAHDSPREPGPADTDHDRTERSARRPAVASLASCALGALGLLGSCAAYEPAPLDPSDILARLDARRWAPPSSPATAASPRELAAFAVTANPELAALRAELGVRRALLVEAGLLPDPELAWDAMDVLASRLVDGTSSSVDAISGLGLMFPLLRPGERDAREERSARQLEEARRRVAAAEWTLTRDVHLASEEVVAAEELLSRRRTLVEVAESTSDYFRRAREAGTATAIQANLALGELHAIRLDAVRAEERLGGARRALCALLGLPPDFAPVVAPDEDPSRRPALRLDADELTATAVELRPDLAELEARYAAAEEGVRLAVAQQLPRIAIGTGIRIELPVFTRGGGPAIETALARREQAGRELAAAVHAARREIADARSRWELAGRELALLEDELLPNAEENLELARRSFREGELTLLETLALQAALAEARTRHAEARAEERKRAWTLLAASGRLLGGHTDEGPLDEESR
jgi:outer membrane protein TolC